MKQQAGGAPSRDTRRSRRPSVSSFDAASQTARSAARSAVSSCWTWGAAKRSAALRPRCRPRAGPRVRDAQHVRRAGQVGLDHDLLARASSLLRNIRGAPAPPGPPCCARNSASVCTAHGHGAWALLCEPLPACRERVARPRDASAWVQEQPHVGRRTRSGSAPAALGSCSCDSILSCCSRRHGLSPSSRLTTRGPLLLLGAPPRAARARHARQLGTRSSRTLLKPTAHHVATSTAPDWPSTYPRTGRRRPLREYNA